MIGVGVAVLTVAVGLVLFALRDSIVFFHTPSDLADKPIAAICHGPWTLINADLVRDRRLTSWPSLRKDLENAGAHWQDAAVVRDGRLITSRNPGDIPAFTGALIELLGATA